MADISCICYSMPICDGYEASSIIRKSESKYIFPPGTGRPRSHVLNRGVPIIAVSANIYDVSVCMSLLRLLVDCSSAHECAVFPQRDRPRLIASGIGELRGILSMTSDTCSLSLSSIIWYTTIQTDGW